jgi:hypothetical protein
MADKKKLVNITRKQLVGVERERVTNRILVIATAVIVVVVLGLIGWGIIQENVIAPGVVVAVVEGEEIYGREFQVRVRANRQQTLGAYVQLVQNYEIFGADPGIGQQILTQLNQLQFQLIPDQMGLTTINQLVDDRLVALEAKKLGITFNDVEIEEELQAFFGYYAEGQPTPSSTPTIAATSTLSENQLAIVTLTSTPTPIPSATPTAREEGDEEDGATPTVEVENATPTVLPTATAFTLESYQSIYAEYLATQNDDIGLTEEDLQLIVLNNLYQNALYDLLTADVPAEQEQVWARHILVETEESANQLLADLESGSDWAELALEHSLDTSNSENGGDLGWFSFETMVTPFANAAFAVEIGEISNPVESDFGWHLIQVIGHEMRPLSAQQYAEARNGVFQEFVQGLRNDYEWEILNTWIDITPDEPEIPFEYRLSQ